MTINVDGGLAQTEQFVVSITSMKAPNKQDALDYHSRGRKGKIEVVPTKPYSSQRDLSLAYSPGVAEPCLAIAERPDDVYKYTSKGPWLY